MSQIPLWVVNLAVVILILALLRSRKTKRPRRETATGRVVKGTLSTATTKDGRQYFAVELHVQFTDRGGTARTARQVLNWFDESEEIATTALEYAKSHPAEVRYNLDDPEDCDINVATEEE